MAEEIKTTPAPEGQTLEPPAPEVSEAPPAPEPGAQGVIPGMEGPPAPENKVINLSSVRGGAGQEQTDPAKEGGVDKIPSIHMGVAASQMERKGIQTEKGNVNRQIAADNKLLKELKARVTQIYNWSKEQAAVEIPQGGDSLVARLYEAQAKVNQDKARSRSGKIKALQENAKLLAFLQGNGINSMQELYEKVSAMNKDYYDLRGQIVGAERRLAVLDERLEMWAQYEKYKPIRQKLDKVKPGKREKYQQEHRAELADFDTAAHFLKSLKESGEAITPKAWRAEAAKLTVQKDADYQKMYAMRDEIKAVENLRKAADRLAHEGQHQQKEQER